jgi:hypothetical protein
VAALLLALIYAPLFHVHDAEDPDHGAYVHAHFPELEEHAAGAGQEIESPHPHAQARSIDVLTTNTTAPVIYALPAFGNALSFAAPEAHVGFVSVETPRAHGPPSADQFSPRSPPTV